MRLFTLVLLAGMSAAQTKTTAPATVEAFREVTLTPRYHSESADVGDFNRDGKPDVTSGPYWYAGPAFTKRHPIYKPVAFPRTSFADQFFAMTLDGIGIRGTIPSSRLTDSRADTARSVTCSP